MSATGLNPDTVFDIESTANYTHGVVGIPDSHEAMNYRHETGNRHTRKKRSFEFLLGLVNNNSRYEVITAEPDNELRQERKKDDASQSATEQLLELMIKIATYPERWRKIHQILRNLEEDLSNTQRILRKQGDIKKQTNGVPSKSASNRKKWPDFDHLTNNNSSISTTSTTLSLTKMSGKSRIEKPTKSLKNFTFHKVTVSGNSERSKKNPTAYVAVSVISPKETDLAEEDFRLETELHQLKPWKNKRKFTP